MVQDAELIGSSRQFRRSNANFRGTSELRCKRSDLFARKRWPSRLATPNAGKPSRSTKLLSTCTNHLARTGWRRKFL